jgi:hypothetical protein
MTSKFASLIILLLLTTAAFGQNTEPTKKTKRPDIPGTFVVELGVNRLTSKPNDLKYGLWGSRTANVYYQYDMRILKSKFSFHPGIGLSMERFKLMSYNQYYTNDTVRLNNPTLIFDNVGNSRFADFGHVLYDGDTLGQINWSNSMSTKKSMLTMTYLDVPLELRFSTKPEDPARSFKIAIGGRVGYLLNASTKVRYKENGDIKKLQNHQDFNLTRLRYGAHMKVFFGNFALFGYYNLTPLFKANKGPAGTDTQTYTVGFALHSF